MFSLHWQVPVPRVLDRAVSLHLHDRAPDEDGQVDLKSCKNGEKKLEIALELYTFCCLSLFPSSTHQQALAIRNGRIQNV